MSDVIAEVFYRKNRSVVSRGFQLSGQRNLPEA